MGKQDSLKMQTYVLKVNIKCVCDGCKEKVKKLIQKTEGVYSTSVDAEQGKVLVSGIVDPDTLVKKLKKSGKHAEVWGGQNANFGPSNQFNGFDNGKGGKDTQPQQHKGGHGQHKGGHFEPVQVRDAKNFKMPLKNQKSVRFNLPEQDEFDASEDDFDGSEDYDDEGDEDFEDDEGEFGRGNHISSSSGNKMMPMMGNGHNAKGGPTAGMIVGNGHGHPVKIAGKNGGGKDAVVNFQKGGAVELPFETKGNGGKPHGKNRSGGKKGGGDSDGGGGNNKKGGKESGGGGGKNGGAKKSGGGLLGFLGFGGKKSKKSEAGSRKNKGNGAEAVAGNQKAKKGGKNGGGDFDDFPDVDAISHTVKVGGGGGGGGGNVGKGRSGGGVKVGQVGPSAAQMGMINNYPMGHHQTGKMDNFPMDQAVAFSAVQGLPGHAAMNGGYHSYQGQGMQVPPSYQQYMPPMMMNSQPHPHPHPHPAANGNVMYQPPMMYARPHPSMNYMPPPPMPSHPMSDPMTHIFSDENTESCSIM